MVISDIALKRPVASVVLSLIIILMGIVGFDFLGVRLYPACDTLSRTSLAAFSKSVPKSNSTVIRLEPIDDCEEIDLTPSIPLIDFSSGSVI